MRVLSIANFKGGTGKTVTACTLAAVLADRGRRVLLIDADAQHNTTDFYGGDPEGITLSDVLTGAAEPYWPDLVTVTERVGLSLLGADLNLLTLDLASMTEGGGSEAIRRLRVLMAALVDDDAYDFVIFDCPPSFTAASVAALSVSDDVIIPTRADAFSQSGVGELVEQIRRLMAAGGGRPGWRILITMTERTNVCRQGAALLRSSFRGAVFDTEIHASVKVEESTFARKPVTEYAVNSKPANDYRQLADEYLRSIEEVDEHGETV